MRDFVSQEVERLRCLHGYAGAVGAGEEKNGRRMAREWEDVGKGGPRC